MSALIKDGIYFNMPDEVYLAEERLSKSGMKRIRVSPADYWAESHLNPNPPDLTPEQERLRYMARVIARAFFVGAGIFAVWSIIHTIREAWPRIKELMEELDNDT